MNTHVACTREVVEGRKPLGNHAAYVALVNAPTRDEGEDAVRTHYAMRAFDRRWQSLANGGRKRSVLPTA